MPCAFVQGLLYVLWSCDHHTCTGSDVMMSQQDTDITSHTTSSPTRRQLMKVLAAENTRNHAGTCPGDVRCHIYVVRRRGRLAPRQPLSVCALLPAYEENRHLRPLGNLGHRLRRPRWID